MKATAFAAIAAVLLAWGCGSPRHRPEHHHHRGNHKNGSHQHGDHGGTNPFNALGALSSLLSGRANQPSPYAEPKTSKGFDDSKPHYAVLELSGAVTELSAFHFYGGLRGTELRKIEDKLHALASDGHVVGLILRDGGVHLGMATAEELRDDLLAFKSAGGRTRKLLCYTPSASSITYYLLTACDSIDLAPTGVIDVSGVAAVPIHIKGLLDKLGIKADFLHIGAFKGAAEPLTRDRPSPETIETLKAIIDTRYQALVRGIADGRKLSPDKASGLIDQALFQGQDAVKAGLVDKVAVFEDFRAKATGGKPWKVVTVGHKPGIGQLMQIIGLAPHPRPTVPHVAVVYAVGEVVDGKGGGIPGAREKIASRTLSAALRTLTADDAVKAIVLRVDSGGGSALASEIIWHAVAAAKAKKPVIVSMGEMAASGAYYISSDATKIYALDNTLTGSIGVVGGKIAYGGALAKIGVRMYPMGKGKHALMWSPATPWTPDARALVHKMMEATYQVFVQRVATGRKKSTKAIQAIAQGRVWTGATAVKNGLVDAIGGLDAAIGEARKLGKVKASAPLEIYPPRPTLLDYIGKIGQVSAPLGLRGAAADLLDGIAATIGVRRADEVASLLEEVVMLRTSPVLTVSFLATALD